MNQIQSEHSHQELAESKPLSTLDQVSNALAVWRNDKVNQGPSIPDEIWLAIFELAKTHPPSGLRSLFQFSTNQYKKKFEQLCKPVARVQAPEETTVDTTATSQENAAVTLCEVKPLYEPDPLPTPKNSMVVEMHKPGGYVMKFHITHSQLLDALKEFLAS